MKSKFFLLAGLGLSLAASLHAKSIELLNVSYDPTRELYVDFNKAFVAHWKTHNPENRASGILTYDGNHFNDAGHRFVAQQMLKMFK